MSGSDYQAGLGVGLLRANTARADASAAIGEWENYSRRLKIQLTEANEKVVFTDAQVDAEASLRKQLEDELKRLKPDHPLLQKDIQRQIKANVMADKLKQHGYFYDAVKFTVTKIG